MSNTKIHIDQLFEKGLENLELPVFSSDFEKIKAEVTDTATNNSLFENFELPVTDKDWQGIKERLEKEPSRTVVLLPTDYAKDVFKDFEIAVTDADWTATKNKLETSSKKKMVWWWWLHHRRETLLPLSLDQVVFDGVPGFPVRYWFLR